MKAAPNTVTRSTRLSEIHRTHHAATLAIAKRIRPDGPAHARLLQLAASCSYYFKTLRSMGE